MDARAFPRGLRTANKSKKGILVENKDQSQTLRTDTDHTHTRIVQPRLSSKRKAFSCVMVLSASDSSAKADKSNAAVGLGARCRSNGREKASRSHVGFDDRRVSVVCEIQHQY